VLSVEQWQTIRHLAALGWSQRRIARETGVSRNTVNAALAAEHPPAYARTATPSPLASWKELVEDGLRKGFSGARMLEELRQAGYQGARSVFYAHWAPLVEARRAPVAACRFETDPGEQAQFDWSENTLSFGGIATRVYVFSLVLGYSRRVHWFPSLGVNQAAVFEALEAGFRHFGGACRYVLVDNAKVFLSRHRGPEVQWNPNFLRLCGHYSVQPIASTPRHPQSKGKVEHPFGCLEQRFLVGAAWRDWDHFQAELAAFEARWEQRIHGTTKVTPQERFTAEQSRLLPLPERPFLHWQETFRQVSKDCLISFEGVRYSVPWMYAGKEVLVRPSQGRAVEVYAPAGKLLARHLLRPSGSPPVLLAEHYEGLRRRHWAAGQTLARRFRERYGSHDSAEAFLQRLLAQHRHQPEAPLRQVLELLTTVPEAVALAALAEAVEFNLCTPRFLAEQLRRRIEPSGGKPSAPPVTQLALPELQVERPLDHYAQALPEGGTR
jgi:transposase